MTKSKFIIDVEGLKAFKDKMKKSLMDVEMIDRHLKILGINDLTVEDIINLNSN